MQDLLDRWVEHAPLACRALLLGEAKGIAAARAAEQAARKLTPLALLPEIGEAWFPVVHRASKVDGGLVRVTARNGDTGASRLDGDIVRRVDAWVARLAGLLDLGVWTDAPIVVHVDRALLDVNGRSMELAAAAARVSAILGRRGTRVVVASGCLGLGPGSVSAVDAIEAKARVVSREAPEVVPALVGVAQDVDPWFRVWFGEDWLRRLCEQLDHPPDVQVAMARRHYEARNYVEAASAARAALLCGVEGVDRGLALWVSGACHLHMADPRAADELDRAREVLGGAAAHEVARWTLQEFDAQFGVRLVDEGRPKEASRILEAALSVLLDVQASERDKRWSEVVVQVAGSLHRARVLGGDLEGAREVLMTSSLPSAPPAERARVFMDLAEVDRRSGRAEQARRRLGEARASVRLVPPGPARLATDRFLRVYEARAGLAAPDEPVVAPDPRAWPQPAAVAERLLAEDDAGALDAWAEAYAEQARALPELLFLAGVGARAAVRRGGVAPGWLSRVGAHMLRFAHLEDVVREAAVELVRGGSGDWERRAPY